MTIESTPTAPAAPRWLRHAIPLLLGIAMTLTLRGYQFGGGNHCVYLIAPLREVHPELLANDWWATHTLQYHVLYTKLAAGLMRLGIIEPAFGFAYGLLLILLHVAWLRIALALKLDARAYVLSVLLYYLSAAGTGLGSYQFLQDSSFLPGNVANVAMLWAILYFIRGRAWPAALTLGIAALFHLNHALIALAFWPIAAWHLTRTKPTRTRAIVTLSGGLLILLFALPNLLPAVRTTLAHLPKMPLGQFVDLYVHLRHPHHYDPLTWPLALWLSFLWPIPLALIAYRARRQETAWNRAAIVFTFMLALQAIALTFAGVLFISEPLIQMSLFRFSIYPKLLASIGAAAFCLDRRAARPILLALPFVILASVLALRSYFPTSPAASFLRANGGPITAFIALLFVAMAYSVLSSRRCANLCAVIVLLAVAILSRHFPGLRLPLADDAGPDYLQLCTWARQNTPADAVFIVPPNEQLFRFHARRAIVVNFKNVPQLSSEMPEWKERLETILDRPLATLPRRFDLAHAAIAAQYDQLPFAHFATVARRYGARYLVTAKPQAGQQAVFENQFFHLYDLNNSPARW